MKVTVYIKQEAYCSTTIEVDNVDEAINLVKYSDWVNDLRVIECDDITSLYEGIEEIVDEDGEVIFKDTDGSTVVQRV